MHDRTPDRSPAQQLVALHRRIEDCVYLLTRPGSPAERNEFRALLERLTHQVAALQARECPARRPAPMVAAPERRAQ